MFFSKCLLVGNYTDFFLFFTNQLQIAMFFNLSPKKWTLAPIYFINMSILSMNFNPFWISYYVLNNVINSILYFICILHKFKKIIIPLNLKNYSYNMSSRTRCTNFIAMDSLLILDMLLQGYMFKTYIKRGH